MHQLWSLYQGLQSIQSHARAEAHERRIEAAITEAERFRREHIDHPTVSDTLGRGRLGDRQDAAERLFDRNGLFLGALDGRPIFYSGDGHMLTYGRTRSGKGRDVILPNLAHVARNSLVVADVKRGENAYSSWEWRSRTLGQRCYALNPWGLYGIPSVSINPLQRLIDKVKLGDRLNIEPMDFALSFVPAGKDGNGHWTVTGAQQIMALVAEYLARFEPENCYPSHLARYVNASNEEIEARFDRIVACEDEDLAGMAGKFRSIFVSAPKQYEGYRDRMSAAVAPYRSGSELDRATRETTFDAASLKREPCSVFVMMPESEIRAAAPWVALSIAHMIETIVRAEGPVRTTFVVDEFANLPYMAVLPKALRMYAGAGFQLWCFCQGRFSLSDKENAGYTREMISEFEDGAGVFQMWGVEDPSLLKDVQLWSGRTVVPTTNRNFSLGPVNSGALSVTETTRDVLQVEDIRAIDAGRQILKLPGLPLFVADRVPWFEVAGWREGLRDPRDVFTGRWRDRPLLA